MFSEKSHQDRYWHSSHHGLGDRGHGLARRSSSYGHDERCGDGHRCRGLSFNNRHRHGRPGERFGWGREGRVRLEEPMVLSNPREGSMSRLLCGGFGGPRLNGGRGGDVLGSPVHGSFQRSQFLGGSSNFLGEHKLDGGRDPYSEIGRGVDSHFGPRDRFGNGSPYMSGGIPVGLGSRTSMGSMGTLDSLGSGSIYSLQHLDRRPRQYHYQPPHVEDEIEDLIEEDMLRREDELMRCGIVPSDPNDMPIFEEDFSDPRRSRGQF